jgi:hypothetical protein
MPTKRNYILPFDVAPKQVAFIPISAEVVSVMLNGDEKEVEAIECILEKWTALNNESPTEFGLYIQRRYGFSVAEEKFRADEKAQQRKTTELSIEIVKTIAQKDGIKMEEAEGVLRRLQSGEGSIAFAQRFPEVMDQALEIGALTSSPLYKVETIYMRRFIPDWPESLTEYLHREILEALAAFYVEEFTPTEGKQDSPEPSMKQIESLELSEST